MCGIAGIWGDTNDDRIAAMANSLRHRGPDGEGSWSSTRHGIKLAHRRLAVIDLEGGRQPITNEDGTVVVMLNGAVYNYRELRDELSARGHTFRTQSDTEVIVHLYEEMGSEFVSKLQGMFAIAVWDESVGELVLVRDRVGKKPLYFSETRGEFLFASEIKGVLVALKNRPSLDHQAIVDYFAWSAIPAPATIYKEVRAVLPGELLVIRDRRVVQRGSYWQPSYLPKVSIPRSEALTLIEDRVRNAVRLRLRSDVPVGTFLSGGLDSGLVTAIAAQESSEPLTTLTVGFEDGSFDERPLARLVAQRYGTQHREVIIRPDLQADLSNILSAYGQPFGSASAIPSYYVSKEARRHVKVVLNGDGGDELFAGYRRYWAGRWSGCCGFNNTRIAGPVWRMLGRCLPRPRRFRTPYAFVHRLIRGMGLPADQRYLSWTVQGIDALELLGNTQGASASHDAMRCEGLESGTRLARRALERFASCGSLDRMMGADFATGLPNDLLVKMDIATMAHGLEARSPLLDHRLIEDVAVLPESMKLSGFQTKPLLRDVCARYLPREICRAPKRGFEVPLIRWLREDLKEVAFDVILTRNALLTELFGRDALEAMLAPGGQDGPGGWATKVWLLLAFGMWDSGTKAIAQQAGHP